MNMLMWIVLIVGLIVFIKFTDKAIQRFASGKTVSPYRLKYITKTINIGLIVIFLFIAINISGLEYSQISIFLSSVFAVIGVALFAQWSILSNVTGSLIIFFSFPYRVGDKIKVIDEQDVCGVIEEITMFNIILKRDNEMITYPNSLILQKGVIKYLEDHS